MDEKTLKNRKLSRRAFLKAAAATAAAGAAGSFVLTGCSPTDDDGDDDIVIDDNGISLVDDYPEVEIKHNVCGVCSAGCAMKVEVADGKVLAIKGNPDDQVAQGHLCVKGYGAHYLMYSPDRLKYPMKRTNPEKGIGVDPQWVQIDWDEAFDIVGTKLKEIKDNYGPESIMMATRPHDWAARLTHAIGTPNALRHHDTCYSTHEAVWGATVTGSGRPWMMDLSNAKYILSLGWDMPGKGKNMSARDYAIALENGAKAVVVDPMLSTTASLADEWLAIKPGTDLAFCLAMINVIVNEDLYDKDFVSNYCSGIDEVKDFIQEYTPEWAAPITEIPADTIARIAKEFATTLPAIIPTHKRDAGGPLYSNSWRTSHAIVILNALVGNIDRKGGYIFSRTPQVPSFNDLFPPAAEFPEKRKDRIDGQENYPLIQRTGGGLGKAGFTTVADGILNEKPYAIKGAFFRKHNTMAFPNQVRFVEALKKLEFIVVLDIIGSELAQMADVVLPEPYFLETSGMIHRNYFSFYPQFAVRQPVHDTIYDTKGYGAIVEGIAKGMGLEAYFEGVSGGKMRDEQLKALGSSWEELNSSPNGLWSGDNTFKPREEFNTPSKKIELYSTALKDNGHDPLPAWEPRREEPKDGEFTFLVTRPACHRMTESQSNEAMMEIVGENVLFINPKAAQDLGINEGDEVVIESRANKIQLKAAFKKGLRPDCVASYHGFGHWSKELSMAYGKGAHCGDLIPDYSIAEMKDINDPGMGGCMNDYGVKVSKA